MRNVLNKFCIVSTAFVALLGFLPQVSSAAKNDPSFLEQVIFPGRLIPNRQILKYHEAEATLPTLNFPLRATPAHMQKETLVKSARITLLTDMIASRRALGEWGLAAFVELEVPLRNGTYDKRYILFDSGGTPDTLNQNLESIGKTDAVLKGIQDLKTFMGGKKLDIVLTHWHSDHTTGIANFLRKYCMANGQVTPDCIVDRIIVGKGFFNSRWQVDSSGKESAVDSNKHNLTNFLDPQSDLYVFRNKIVKSEVFSNLYADSDAVWMSGYIPRVSGENNQASNSFNVLADDGTKEGKKINDELPEEIALYFGTANGVVVLTGCAHGGIINSLYNLYAHTGGVTKIDAVLGGLHLMGASKNEIEGTLKGFKKFTIKYLLGGHCTGLDMVHALRSGLEEKQVHTQASSVQVRYELGQDAEGKVVSKVINPSPTTLNRIKQ